MATVTYRNQPAIHATRGAVPLAGTAHVYTVGKVLWPEAVSDFLVSLFLGPCLHVCCGKSTIGDCRLDLNECAVDVRGDAARLPFKDESWPTVLCDPPYNGKFQWNHDLLSELARVAQQRIIFQHWFMPVDSAGRFKKAHRWSVSGVYVWQPRTYFGRVQVITVLDAPQEISDGCHTAPNRPSVPCPNVWHDGWHGDCGICPDCGEVF